MSQSMAKSINGMLIGIATAEGAIKSIDDAAEVYVPGLKGTEYGATPIRALLHMSSGVKFGEENEEAKGGGGDLDRLWGDMVRKHWFSQKGTVASIAQFNQRRHNGRRGNHRTLARGSRSRPARDGQGYRWAA